MRAGMCGGTLGGTTGKDVETTLRALGTDGGLEPPKPARGRRLAVAALLLLPAVVVVFVALELLGTALQHALGLEEGQLLTDAGGRGAAATVLVVGLSAVVPVIGILLALQARKRGEGRLGTVALVVWALVGIGFVVVPTLVVTADALFGVSLSGITALLLRMGPRA